MPNYQDGKIYTIRCRTDDTLIYVGSTTQSLVKRWGGHKVKSREDGMINRMIYNTINNEWNNWYIELHSLYPCSCKEELCKREGEIIREIGTLNKTIIGRTNKEWHEDNKEQMKQYKKKYREEHKAEILQNKREYYEKIKDTETYINKAKEHYENNKEYILNKHKERTTCECGCSIIKYLLPKHRKTLKHIKLLEEQQI